MTIDLLDHRVRMAAFSWLQDMVQIHGDVLPRALLVQGFQFEGQRVPLQAPQGIFKPRILDLPLTITTVPDGPYDDEFTDEDLIEYRYRGDDPLHPDNVGLRNCLLQRRPLIYLRGIVKGRYLATWPAYVGNDDPDRLTFTILLDDAVVSPRPPGTSFAEPEADARRRYVTATVKRRLHQRTFRERVLAAYRDHCALCRLRHRELLEAAHIVPDTDPHGEPVVSNGLSLCKLHHAAFDRNILGIRPDFVAEIRFDVLQEIDGPMLKHGLQEMHGTKLLVPRRADLRPDANALEERYEAFRSAG